MTHAPLNLPYGGMWVNNIKKEEEKGDLKLLRGEKKTLKMAMFFCFRSRKSGREAIRWSLLQGKRVTIFGPKNPEIAYCPRVDPEWRNMWLEVGGVCVWSSFSGPPGEGFTHPQMLTNLHTWTQKPPSAIWLGTAHTCTEKQVERWWVRTGEV